MEFAALEGVTIRPAVSLVGGRAQVMDLTGDGQPDIVAFAGPTAGLYEHDMEDGWLPFRPFTSPEIRMSDLRSCLFFPPRG